jgi:hypothetical protein
MEASQTWTGRCTRRVESEIFGAAVVVRAWPTDGEASTMLAPEADETLRKAFGPEADHYRSGVCASIELQIRCIGGYEGLPAVRRSRFGVEIVQVQPPRDATRPVSEFLLMIASMNAIAEYLQAFEEEQSVGG